MSRLAALAVLAFAPLAVADDKSKPAFTEKDLADGWVTLFDCETTYGWTVKGDAKVEDRTLILKEKASFTYSLPLPPGELLIGGRVSNPVFTGKHAGGVVKFDTPSELNAIHFKPDNTKPIFNGKDLSGWKVFQDEKRSKSKFEVTKDGEIHLTNGPGDLQTEGRYADFVLQLEFKTNGDGLSGGGFFRTEA
ncbi:MAG: family 16 glycoside hydrolase, partial [Gemmataceae bacterium]